MTTNVRFERLTTACGAEVFGVDLREEQPQEVIDTLRSGLLEHLVLFFRDQEITPQDQIRFCEYFGPVKISEFQPPSDDPAQRVPGITVIDQGEQKYPFTDTWHTDHTFTPETPLATCLHSIVVPSVGGDTCFANMYDAYDALSPAMQEFLSGLTALHTSENQLKVDGVIRPAVLPQAEHPVIVVHPETGRKVIFVNINYTQRILELKEEESALVLKFLFEHVKQPQLQCRFKWTANAVTIWDNRALQHCAVYDYTERRLMHRSLVAGGQPRGAKAAPELAALATSQ